MRISMRSEADIWGKYCQQGIVRGGQLYLSLPQALKFVADCQLNNLAIIGIEGFLYDRGKIKPILEAIRDFSRAPKANCDSYREICDRAANDFLHQLDRVNGVKFRGIVGARMGLRAVPFGLGDRPKQINGRK
ncbi:MAG: hypothetical protein GDA38_22785 [Hormoscilla sp. SP12CHS1]|nr:hypothetical protein [Hormoscilla sp. SP12CHS1]